MNTENVSVGPNSPKNNWINRHPIITIIGLLILISPIISFLSGGSGSSTSPSEVSSASLKIGDIGYMKSTNGSTFVSSTKDVEDRVVQLSVAGDTQGLMQMVLTGDPLVVDDGTQVRVIGASFTSVEVRIVDGKFVGESGWVPSEFVTTTTPTVSIQPTTTAQPPKKKVDSSQTTINKTDFKISEPIKLGNYVLTVNSFDKCIAKYPQFDQDNYPLAVSITQKNTGTKPLQYNMYDFSLVDMFGDTHTPTIVMCDKDILADGIINPGETMTGYLGFDIPTSIIPDGITKLIFEPNTIGLKNTKITVELKNN